MDMDDPHPGPGADDPRDAEREREAYLLQYYQDLVQETAEFRMVGRLFVAHFKLRRKLALAERDRLFLKVPASLTLAHARRACAHACTHTHTHTHTFARPQS